MKSYIKQGSRQKLYARTAIATAVVSCLGLGLSPSQVFAQDGQENSGRLGSLIEEVVVTARKREETIQDAPLAVTALSGDSLEVRGITNISEIGNITPNLTYQNSPAAGGSTSVATVYIRGIGQRDFLGTIDNGVGFYIDDVYIARTIGATVDLVDVERVEVLRGPQGTLFGRNNVGGAIRLVSKKPGDEFGGYVSGTVGTDSLFKIRAKVDAPITENLLSSFIATVGMQDGYVDRPAGGDLGDDDVKAIRANFLWYASDAVEVSVAADYSKEEENGAPFTLASAGVLTGGFADFYNNNGGPPRPPIAPPDCAYPGGITSTNPLCYNDQYTSTTQNFGTAPTYSDTQNGGIRLGIEWDINDNLQLKSITAGRYLDSQFAKDSDGSPLTIVHFFDDFITEQFSQELQLSGSSFDNSFDWITGLYYFDEDGSNLNVLDFAIANFPSFNEFTTESKAIFAQGTYHATDNFDVTLGLRSTKEDKTFDPVQTTGPNNIGLPVGIPIVPFGINERSTSETSPSLNLAYNFSDDLLTYFNYSEGFRSGGFVQRIFPPLPFVPDFGPEFVESYEVGFKYNADTVSLNGALFTSDYTDIQVRTQNPGFIGFFEANVGDAEINGLELELKWQPADSWFLEAAYGYTDAKYTAIRVEAPLVSTVGVDNEFDHVPENSASISLSKEFYLQNGGSLVTRLSGNYHSDYFNNPDNTEAIKTPAVDIWDATLAWTSSSEKYNVNFGVKNLTDDKYRTAGYNNTAIGHVEEILDRGLTWYLTGKYNF